MQWFNVYNGRSLNIELKSLPGLNLIINTPGPVATFIKEVKPWLAKRQLVSVNKELELKNLNLKEATGEVAMSVNWVIIGLVNG